MATIDIIAALMANFAADEARYTSNASGYTEMEARAEFIDPLFSCLGWDMQNTQGLPNRMKDVVREESQAAENSTKRPDYTFRIAANRKFFVEAKKPSVDIRTRRDSAFQVRSYGWTAGMGVSILTNFHTLRVYDTRSAPLDTDNADVGLLLDISYNDLVNRFEEFEAIFGRDAVVAGSIEANYDIHVVGNLPVNEAFLERINSWRLRLAEDLYSRYRTLRIDELNDLTQKIINRIIFIRMCEDRGIEGEERLRRVATQKNLVELRRLFRELDERYNTGLFDSDNDPFQTQIAINSQLFLDIVEELYFPNSPYSFSVLDANFLGQVYERFLVKRLIIGTGRRILLEDKPAYEDREIVTTPQPLVDEIVNRAFSGLKGRLQAEGTTSFNDLKNLKILDIAVGSSRFLLRSLDELVDAAIEYFSRINDTQHIYRRTVGDYRLSFEAKKELLKSSLFGIDIDYNAVEVARFSLLVKLLEDENRTTLPAGRKILPNLDSNIIWGNSVVDTDFTDEEASVMSSVNPLDWQQTELPEEFDLIVGNPPYIKTEEMFAKSPEEFEYFKITYETPYKQFDKYFVFIERAIQKMKVGAWFGMVVPNKWINIESGKKLRALLSDNNNVAEIVNFGNELIFEGKSTYVCLLVLSNSVKETFYFRNVNDYSVWLTEPSLKGRTLPSAMIQSFGGSSWVLPANDIEAAVLAKLYTNSVHLGKVADVKNGIQTSAENVFPISEYTETAGVVQFTRGELTWNIESSLLKPYLMDSSLIKSYLPITGDARIIFPYEFGDNGEPIFISPQDMRRHYPLAWRYLNHFKPRLLERKVSPPPGDGEFYRYGRHQALATAFMRDKIIYSVNQLGNKYGIDRTGIGFASGGTAGEVAISNPRNGYSLEFILGLLNQRVVEFYMRKRGSAFRGGYYSRGSAVVNDLPVPILDFENPAHADIHQRITELVRSLITTETAYERAIGRRKENLATQRNAAKTQLKSLYDRLWDFDGEDNDLILPGEI